MNIAKQHTILTLLMLCVSISAVLFYSCTQEQATEAISGASTVRGTVTVDGSIIAGATVWIDSVLNWSAVTDADGKFLIKNVTTGTHSFNIEKSLENGKAVSQSTTIAVAEGDNDLGPIKLPLPSAMYPINPSAITIASVSLSWSKTIDEEFREYKIYRKEDPGLDETTGKLIFVSTSKNDTTFVDKDVITGGTYYYRVFILSSFGKLGGSNLVNATLPAINHILNPSFENSADGLLPDNWELLGTETEKDVVRINSEEKVEGKNSVKIHWTDTSYVPHIPGDLDQYIRQTTDFIVGRKYMFSYWSKVDSGGVGVFISLPGFSKGWTVRPSPGWRKDSVIFTFTEHGIITLLVCPVVMGTGTTGFVKGWVDDLKLTVIP
ncbi:MAG: carboxypeptidase-like regulatory domain-containing protein [Bacteroidota bacterium]